MEITYLGGLHTSKLIEDTFKEYFSKVMKSLNLNEEGFNYRVYNPKGYGIMLDISFKNDNNKLPTFDINGKSYEVLNDICSDYVKDEPLSSAEIEDIFEVIDNEIILK